MKVNFKSYLRTLLAAAAVMFMAPGCDDDGTEQTGPTPTDPGKEVPSYTFSINVSSVLDSRVSVLVTPSELGATFYCGVATKELFDVFASDAAFLANDVENLQKEALDREMNFQSYLETVVSVSSTSETVTVPVSGLTKQTEYYAYCYGITLNGEVTSPLAKVAFTSGTPAPVDLVLSSEAKDITTDAVKVAVSALRANGEENGQNGYICEVQLKKTVDDFFADDAALISALEDMYAKADPKNGLQGKVFHGSQEVAVSGLLSGAEYYMILFGYDSTGVTTEVKKSTFTTQEKSGGNQGGDDTKVGYESWLGTWTVTSASSEGNKKPVSFEVTFEQKVAGSTYKVTGWGISKVRTQLSFEAYYDEETSAFFFTNANKIGYDDSEEPSGWYVHAGRFLDPADGKYYLLKQEDIVTLIGQLKSATSAVVDGATLTFQDEPGVEYKWSSSDYFFFGDNGSIYNLGYADGFTVADMPVGPYTMTKVGGGDNPDPSDGPSLTLGLRAGDKNGANTDTYLYFTAKSPEAVSAKIFFATKEETDNFLSQYSMEEIAEQGGMDLTQLGANAIEVLNKGLGLEVKERQPATAYTFIFLVEDANGKKTVKSITESTTGSTGPASDAYNAWIGTWSVTSTSSDVSKQPITFEVSIAQKATNSTYSLTGWGISTPRTRAVTAYFDATTGNLQLKDFNQFGTDSDGYALVHLGILDDGKLWGDSSVVALVGASSSATSATVTGTSVSYQGKSLAFVACDYFAVNPTTQEIYSYYAAEGFTDDDYPIGPYTMTKKSATPAPAYAQAASMSKMLTSAYLGAPKKSIKTIGASFKAKMASVAMIEGVAIQNPLMQLGREESILDRTAVASSSNSASLKIYKTVSDIRVRTARTK